MTRAICAVCLRSIFVTFSGLIRVHGPINNRCLGSNKQPTQPRPVTQSTSASAVAIGTPSLDSAHPAASIPATITPSPTNTAPPATTRLQIPHVRILKRIPRASKEQSSAKFVTLLEGVLCNSSPAAWERLFFLFCTRCLRVPQRCGRRSSLASLVNK